MSTVGSLIISDSKGLFLKTHKSQEVSSNNPDTFKQIDSIGSLSELIPNSDGSFLIQLIKSKAVKIYDIINGIYILDESLPGLLTANFSPQSNYIYTWQTGNSLKNNITTNNNVDDNIKMEPFTNMKIFKLSQNNNDAISRCSNVKKVGQFPLSYRFNTLYWSFDEQLVMFIEKECLYFFEHCNFNDIPKGTPIIGLCNASLSPHNKLVSLHTFDKSRNINLVRIFYYPNFILNSAVASVVLPVDAKSVEFKWNSTGKAVLIIAEVESQGKSYYDEKRLYFLTSSGDSVTINLKPPNHAGSYAIHDIAWTPDGKYFAVIHGSLPAETYLYDLKCNLVFKFPKATRNILYFNPFGNVLCTTAHGNAHGDVEMWNMETFKLISRFPVKTKNKCIWFPDGKHMIFAVTSPTLRYNNGYEIWTFLAEKVSSFTYDYPAEMFDIFPVKNECTSIQKPILPKLAHPIDLISSLASKVYVPKTSKKYLDDELNNMGFKRKQIISSYYSKTPINKINLQNNPFFNHKSETQSSSNTVSSSNETEQTNEYRTKLKSLNKKVNDIRKLKTKIKNEGYTPNSDQLLKLESEPFLIEEKTRLEQILNGKT